MFVRYSLASVIVFSCGLVASAAEKYEVEIKKDVVYGTAAGDNLLLDLALPKEAKEACPVIVIIHGGGWAGGTKDKGLAQSMRPYAATGYVVASVEYRFAPKHTFPAQVEDVKCAVRYLRAHAKQLNLDPKRVGAMGDSAGGHLSLLLGTLDPSDGLEGTGGWPDEPSKVQAVVDYYGPTSLTEEFPGKVPEILRNFIGGTREEKKDAYKQASPLSYVNEGDAPTLIFHGTVDALVPHDQAVQFANAMTKAKIPGRVELLVGKGHGWGGDDAARTSKLALEFFDSILKKGN